MTIRSQQRKENEAIRDALLKAANQEELKKPFNLSGRGHEPRVTLDLRLAATVRSISLPFASISGFGANRYYPKRVFKRAANALKRKLGFSPLEFSNYESSVYRTDTTKSQK